MRGLSCQAVREPLDGASAQHDTSGLGSASARFVGLDCSRERGPEALEVAEAATQEKRSNFLLGSDSRTKTGTPITGNARGIVTAACVSVFGNFDARSVQALLEQRVHVGLVLVDPILALPHRGAHQRWRLRPELASRRRFVERNERIDFLG